MANRPRGNFEATFLLLLLVIFIALVLAMLGALG